MNKKIKNKYVVLIIVFISFLLLVSFYFIIKDDRKLSLPERAVKESVVWVQKMVYSPFKYITNKVEEWIEMKELYQNLKQKEQKLASYDQIDTMLKEKEAKIKELEGLLELNNNLSDYTSISSSVISRNVGYWYDTLTIDKGSSNGIKEGMAVVTSYGLIGKIMKVTSHTSTVKLLTGVNESFQVSVKIQIGEEYLYGLLSNYKDGYLIINGISDNREIPKNSKVMTTGLDNIFPSGILIGYTEKEEKDNFDLARTIYVTPVHNLDDINYVSVLKRRDES